MSTIRARDRGIHVLPRVDDVIEYWYDTGAFGATLVYCKIIAVSKNKQSVRLQSERLERPPTGWFRFWRVVGGGLGGKIVRRGEWTGFMPNNEDRPPCPACNATSTIEACVLGYSCDCVTCVRCCRTYKRNASDGPRLASTDELAAQFDKHNDGLCALCWEVVIEDAKGNRTK